MLCVCVCVLYLRLQHCLQVSIKRIQNIHIMSISHSFLARHLVITIDNNNNLSGSSQMSCSHSITGAQYILFQIWRARWSRSPCTLLSVWVPLSLVVPPAGFGSPGSARLGASQPSMQVRRRDVRWSGRNMSLLEKWCTRRVRNVGPRAQNKDCERSGG